ncbi:MAG: hypothetical protein QOI28_2274, partial [Mycobacterium sp.]|nr:hypothetical protein [Mycobacterium sp.]
MAAFTTASRNTQVGAEFRDRFADDGHVLADELADHRGEARSAPRTACCSPASPVGPPRSVFGLPVVCRTTTEPGRIAASSPSSTQVCLTCSSVKTQTTTTSASLAAPAISSTASAPSSVTASRLSSVRPSARTWWPASTRRRTIGAPIRPEPMTRRASRRSVLRGAPITSRVPSRNRGGATAHRRIDHRNTFVRSRLGDLATGVGMHGAVDFDDAARRRSGQHFGIASRTCLSSSSPTTQQADQIAGRTQFGRCRGHLRRGVGIRLDRCGPARPQRRARNLPRRSALTARSDEPDAHQPASTSTS